MRSPFQTTRAGRPPRRRASSPAERAASVVAIAPAASQTRPAAQSDPDSAETPTRRTVNRALASLGQPAVAPGAVTGRPGGAVNMPLTKPVPRTALSTVGALAPCSNDSGAGGWPAISRIQDA